MSERTDGYVELFFGELPHDRETLRAKERVQTALAEKENSLSFEEIAETYSGIDRLATLGGFSVQEARDWRSGSGVLDLSTTRRKIKKRRRIYVAIAALAAISVTELSRGIYRAVLGETASIYCFILSVLSFAGAFFACMQMRPNFSPPQARYDAASFEYLRTLSDKYVKRTVHLIARFFFLFALFLMSEWKFRYMGHSKVVESAKHFADRFPLVAVALFFLVLDVLLVREVQGRAPLPKGEKIPLHLSLLVLSSAIFWMTAAILVYYFGEGTFSISSVVYFALFAVYNGTLRKRVTHRNFVLERKRVVGTAAVVTLVAAFSFMNRDTWYLQPYINSVVAVPHGEVGIAYDEESGVYTLTMTKDSFKILHLTDIHLGGSLLSREKDLLALRACYAEIEYAQPDFVIVTGDLCYPVGISSFSFNNSAPVQQFAAFMRNVGIPWAFTYGNHDTENIASMQGEALGEVFKALSYKTSGTLLYPYVQPSVTGRNNQLIEVRNADGSLNTALFLLDSNAYSGEGINQYDYIHDDQVDWYESEVRRLQEEEGGHISSLVFIHIPLQEYRTAYELYLEGSDRVTYYFGENNETLRDTVCCSEHPSALFDRITELGSTTGVFCGHDHYNNLSVEYRGVRLTYGMSIDYLVMPGIAEDTAQRGAEIITLNGDSSWDVWQIPLVSIE